MTELNPDKRQSWHASIDNVSLHTDKIISHSPRSRVPVDRGWGWVVVLASFMVQMIDIGAAKSFGVLFVEFSERYDGSPDAAAWITALNGFMAMCLAPFTTALGQRFSNRAVVIVGGLLVSLGYVLSAFVVSLPHLYITYGFVAGAGVGLSFAPSVVVLGEYFKNRRALANGLAVAGSGVGSFIVPPLYRILIDSYGLQGALIIFGALALNVCVSGALMTPKTFYEKDRFRPSTLQDKYTQKSLLEIDDAEISTAVDYQAQPANDINKTKPSTLKRIYLCMCFQPQNEEGYRKPLFDRQLLSTPIFYVYAIALLVSNMGYPSVFVMIPPYAGEQGISKTKSALLVSSIGIADLIGRIGFGYIMDYNLVKKKYAFFGSFVFNGLCCVLFPFAWKFEWLVVIGVIFGLFGGSYIALIPVMFIEALGVDKLANAYGLAVMGQGVAMLAALPFMGFLRQITGSWSVSFWVCAAAFFIAALCGLFERLVSRYNDKSGLQTDDKL